MSVQEVIPDFVYADMETLGFELPEVLLEKLARYLDHLLETNQRMNLTAIRDRDVAWRRMIIDSLTLLPGLEDLEAGTRCIDVGTGGGLPGIPVAIARPDLSITLLEATGKKVRFLEETIELLGLENVKAIQGRAETLGQDADHRQRYEVAMNRAVGPMAVVLELSLPLVKTGGRMLAMKGPKLEEELMASGDALAVLGAGELQVVEAYPAGFENDLVIAIVEKERATPREYPREPGVPKQQPIGG